MLLTRGRCQPANGPLNVARMVEPQRPKVRDAFGAMIYAHPLFSAEAVDAAGRVIAGETLWTNEYEKARAIVNNWRSSHSFPLNTFQVTLKAYSKQIESD